MSSKITIHSTNDFAPGYYAYIQNCHWVGPDVLFGLMSEYIKPGQTLLDVGIGTGLASIPFKEFGLKIFGVDGAEQMIRICREKQIAENLWLVDLTKDQEWFEDKSFDHIISHAVFHLFGDLDPVFKNIANVLKNQGCFAFTCEGMKHPSDDYRETLTKGLFERQNTPADILAYRHTEEYMYELLHEHGFKLLKKTEFLAFIDPTTQASTYFEAMIVRKVGR